MAEIKGTNSNEKLTGTILNDQIYGFKGNDYLDGEAGQDYLAGGSGADRYVFSFQSDSPDTGPDVNGDTIIGFNRDEGDKIDLSKIDADLGSIFDSVIDLDDLDLPVGPPPIDFPVFFNAAIDIYSDIYSDIHSYIYPNDKFEVDQLSYSDGVLHADVIDGPDVEIALAGAPSLNILTDVIL
jgi:hypothetical protein